MTLCNLLGLLGRAITQNNRTINRDITFSVANSLANLSTNRVIHVQEEAKKAAANWRDIIVKEQQSIQPVTDYHEIATPPRNPRLLQVMLCLN